MKPRTPIKGINTRHKSLHWDLYHSYDIFKIFNIKQISIGELYKISFLLEQEFEV